MENGNEKRQSLLRFFWQEALRDQFVICLASMAILAVFMFVCCALRPEVAEWYVDLFLDSADVSALAEQSESELFFSILINNGDAALTTVLWGFFPFLFLPALTVGINSLVLGAFAAYFRASGGGLGLFLLSVLPHGVFELPGLAVACGAGLHLCSVVTARLLHRTEVRVLPTAALCVRALTHIALPLLLLAAAIEAYVTPALLALVV